VISIDALRIGVVMKPLLHYIRFLVQIYYLYLVVELGSSSSLAML